MDRGGDDLFGRKPLHEVAAGDNVRDGVDRPDFMEVDEGDLAPVGAPFRGGQAGVDGAGVVRDSGNERQGVDHAKDIGQRTVLVVMVMMLVVVVIVMMVMSVIVVVVVMMAMSVIVVVVDDLLLAVDADGEVRRRDAAAGDRLADKFDAGNAERVELVERGLWVGLEFKKGGGEHVACGTH